MCKIEVSFGESTHQFLKNLAKKKKKTIPEAVCCIIKDYKNKVGKKDSLYNVIGIADVKDNILDG